MKTRDTAFVIILFTLTSLSSHAQTYSGTALSGLDYEGNPGDAQYVAGTSDYAQLYTADAGLALTADAPAVFATGPFGTLGNFTATYDLLSASTPAGTAPYWIVWVSPPGDNNPSDEVAVIELSLGATLGTSSMIHVYDPNFILGSYFGDTLGTLDNTSLGAYTFGDMTVDYAGVEIGDWNVSDSLSAYADIDEMIIGAVPDNASTLFLAGAMFTGLALFGFRERLSKKPM